MVGNDEGVQVALCKHHLCIVHLFCLCKFVVVSFVAVVGS